MAARLSGHNAAGARRRIDGFTMIAFLHSGLGYIVPFLFVLTVLVFVHEFGHYFIARRNGVRIDVFSIGFGPEVFGWHDRAGTRWKFSAIPLGGYVKMFGDSDASSGLPAAGLARMTPAEREVSFHYKRLGQRAAIVVGRAGGQFRVRDRRAGGPVHDLRPAVHPGASRAGAAGQRGRARRHQAGRPDRQDQWRFRSKASRMFSRMSASIPACR